VESSVYCLPADLLGEGADRVVGTVRDRAGVSGVTVAACYHASRDILPRNPAYRAPRSAPTPPSPSSSAPARPIPAPLDPSPKESS